MLKNFEGENELHVQPKFYGTSSDIQCWSHLQTWAWTGFWRLQRRPGSKETICGKPDHSFPDRWAIRSRLYFLIHKLCPVLESLFDTFASGTRIFYLQLALLVDSLLNGCFVPFVSLTNLPNLHFTELQIENCIFTEKLLTEMSNT